MFLFAGVALFCFFNPAFYLALFVVKSLEKSAIARFKTCLTIIFLSFIGYNFTAWVVRQLAYQGVLHFHTADGVDSSCEVFLFEGASLRICYR